MDKDGATSENMHQLTEVLLSPRFDEDNDDNVKKDPQACLEVFVTSSANILSNSTTVESVVSYVAHNLMRCLTSLGICSLERRHIIAPEFRTMMEEARPHVLEALDKRMFYQLYVRNNLYNHLETISTDTISTLSEPIASATSVKKSAQRKRQRNQSRTEIIDALEGVDSFRVKSDSVTRSTSRTVQGLQNFVEESVVNEQNAGEDSEDATDRTGDVRRRTVLVKSSSDPALIDTKFSDEAFQANIQAVWQMEVAPSRWLSLIIWFLTTFALLVFCMLNYRTSYFLTSLEGSFIAGLQDAFVEENMFSSQPGFREIGDDEGWFDWLEGAVLANLYADNAPLMSSMPSDIMRFSRLVGVPRIVNIQVPNQTCAGSASDACVAPVLESLLDTVLDAHTEISYDGELSAQALDKAWQVDTAVKHAFMIPLPYNNRTHAAEIVARMKKDSNFFNKNTAALGVQFSVYNANLNVISTISLVSYFDPSGYAQPYVSMPLFLSNFTGGWQLAMMLVLLVLFTWRAISEMNECRKSRPIVQIGDPSVSTEGITRVVENQEWPFAPIYYRAMWCAVWVDCFCT
jgi:hypothetical protein